jgi:hypothetical protein
MSFEEKLISAVYLRRFIYDKVHPGHMKKGTLDAAWTEIAAETGKSGIIINILITRIYCS